MDLIYSFDVTSETTKAIGNGLRAYNNLQTGDLENGGERFYLMEKDRLIGAIDVYFFWETLGFGDVYYEHLETLKVLMNIAHDYFKDKTKTIECSTFDRERLKDYQAIGFNVYGEIKDMPKGETFYELVNYDYEAFEIEHNYRIYTSKTVDVEVVKTFESEMKDYNKSIGKTDEKEIIQFAVKDGDCLVGGIYGYIELNYAYVSLLWIDDAYRKNKIGTKLMDLFEEKSDELECKNLLLGTAEFQARGFYEKRGYKVVGELNHCPGDSTNYTMVKYLK